jgi:MFS transporter, MHS family, proline/betaine transporter
MKISKEVWIGWIASMVEAYNMAIYSFVAPMLTKFLFKEDSGIFFSYVLVFVAAGVFYPLGAIYYGSMGDSQGRQKACVYSTLGLGLATGLMGCVPFNWVFFLLLLCAQYFFSGGEYQSSIVFSLEHAGKKQTGLMSSLSCLFAVFGLVAASGCAALVGVRFCFILGGLGGLVSYLLKYYCRETPAFIAIEEKGKGLSVMIQEWRRGISVVGVFGFFMVSYVFIFIFLPIVHPGKSLDTMKSLIVYGLSLVAAGFIADRFGLEKVMRMGTWAFALFVVPLCLLCKSLLVVQTALTLCASLVIGPIHSWVLNQFEVKNRCRGIFISSAIAIAIFGGGTVPFCLMIWDSFHSLALCALYPVIVALIAGLCLSYSSYARNLSLGFSSDNC